MANKTSGVAMGGVAAPPGSIMALKKCTFSYDAINAFFGWKILDSEILTPPERVHPPLENFLATRH